MPPNFNVLESYRDPYADQRGGPSGLTREYPKLSGFLQGFLGSAPDELGSGSVLDAKAATQRTALRSGAEYGYPMGIAASVAPLLRSLGLMTRTGRNAERFVRGTSPLKAAMDELSRVPSSSERAIAVSKRGVAGPVRVGTAGAVTPGRESRLARAMEDFHTHSETPGVFGLHPGDVAQSKRARTTIIHTDPEGNPTGRMESLADPQSHVSPSSNWSYADPEDYRRWLQLRGKYLSNVPDELYNQTPWGDLMEQGGFMATPMDATYRAIKKLNPEDLGQALSRAESLPNHIDPNRYSPAALARIASLKPAAQRGFSESMVSTRSPFGAELMTPSEFLNRTPALEGVYDRSVIEKLKPSLRDKGVQELPALWIDQLPTDFLASFEGRHRMQALRELYGDEPVLMSLLKGNRFEPRTDIFGKPYNMPVEELSIPTDELLSHPILMGDRPLDLHPLWSK